MLLRVILLLLAPTVFAAESRLTNLSVRSSAGSDAATLIVGFSVGGTGGKEVLVRGIGPSLSLFGLNGVVADPQLRLFSGNALLQANDDWGGSAALNAAFTRVGAFSLAAASRDAALLTTLQPGPYSAQLITPATGVGLIEAYDTELGAGGAYFTNVSARSIAGAGANVLTVGFAITGTTAKAVLIRGVGPGLAAFGLSGTLVDPQVRLFDAAGAEIATNTDWNAFSTPASLFTSVGAFALPAASRDAALFVSLAPGIYTAQVSGAGTATGAALIELYEVNNPPAAAVLLQPYSGPALGTPADPGVGTASPGPDAIPIPLTQARPVYPFELRAAGIAGEALIDFYVKTDGTVANAAVVRTTDLRFGNSALTAVRQWTFVPGRRNGVLVVTHLQVPVIFTLN